MHYETDRLLEASRNSYDPFLALVAYKDGEGDYYIESHRIDRQGRMLEGVPLSMECIAALAGSFSAEYSHMPSGRIPPNLLYADNRQGRHKYVWYNPPGQRMMYFSKSLNIENGLYHTPGVVYLVEDNRLDIYAFKGREPKDKLYDAPFFNVSGSAVCLGSSSLERPAEPSYTEIMEFWEKRFWASEFSHLGNKGNPTKNNLYLVTKKMKERFDCAQLILSGNSLKDLLQ